jgi:[acyl-carrier-protein] S-malonyltransferase
MIAFVFPGQGSQSAGMAHDLYEGSATARTVLDDVAAALDFPLLQLMFEGPAEELTLTQNAQPALLAHSAAATAVLREAGVVPAVVAGHSLGEYSALVAAGCLSPVEAVRLVRARGELMADVGRQVGGTMAAVIGLPQDLVEQAVADAAQVGTVCLANLNALDQIVISGEEAAVKRASELASEAGAKRVLPLTVSGAFHSPLMQPAADRFAAVLGEVPLQDAAVPVVSNVDAIPRQDAQSIRAALLAQLTGSVRWYEGAMRMVEMGTTTCLEAGPGKVLTNMMRRAQPEVACYLAGDMASIAETIEALAG